MAFVLHQSHRLERVDEAVMVGEIIIASRHVGVPYRSGRICLYRAAKHVVVGEIAVNNARSHIKVDREQPPFGGVVDGGACAIFLAVSAFLYAVGIAVIGRDTVVRVGSASAYGEGVLLLESNLLHKVEEVFACAEVHGGVTRGYAQRAVIVGIHHVKVAVCLVPRQGRGICGVGLAVACAFFGGDDDYTVGATGSVDGRSSTVLKDVE